MKAGTPAADRLIPARAGNTRPNEVGAGANPAHPRSRGEHLIPFHTGVMTLGSSPLARGTRIQYRGDATRRRLIPARAGNTRYSWRKRRKQQAHPRSRGEHFAPLTSTASRIGSSPLARGTPPYLRLRRTRRRLIPARAGNTPAHPQRKQSPAAHPRSRGEHGTCPASRIGFEGSSPLARGTQSGLSSSISLSRLIPARAGNTA